MHCFFSFLFISTTHGFIHIILFFLYLVVWCIHTYTYIQIYVKVCCVFVLWSKKINYMKRREKNIIILWYFFFFSQSSLARASRRCINTELDCLQWLLDPPKKWKILTRVESELYYYCCCCCCCSARIHCCVFGVWVWKKCTCIVYVFSPHERKRTRKNIYKKLLLLCCCWCLPLFIRFSSLFSLSLLYFCPLLQYTQTTDVETIIMKRKNCVYVENFFLLSWIEKKITFTHILNHKTQFFSSSIFSSHLCVCVTSLLFLC